MNLTQSLFRQTLLTCSLTTLLLSGVEFPLTFSKAAGQDFGFPPGANQPGGGRSPCPAAVPEKVLTALVDDSAYNKPLLTTQERPTFLFYVPFSRTLNITSKDGETYNVTSVEFELRDEKEKSVMKKIRLSLPDQPGIVKLTLPSTEARLEPDKEYFWIFRVICNPKDNTANPTVAGWIKRVRVGSSENVGFDRLDWIVQSRTNHLDSWTELLRKFDIQDLAQAPIVELKPEPKKNEQRDLQGSKLKALSMREEG